MDQSGRCCLSGFIDECGVCDGDATSCSVVISMGFTSGVETSPVDPQAWQQILTSRLGDITGTAINVLPFASSAISAPLKSSQPMALNVTFLAARLSYMGNTSSATSNSTSSKNGKPVAAIYPSPSGPFRFTLSEVVPLVMASLRLSPLTVEPRLKTMPNSPPPSVSIYMVERDGICGNGICEVGEQQWTEPLTTAGQVRAWVRNMDTQHALIRLNPRCPSDLTFV